MSYTFIFSPSASSLAGATLFVLVRLLCFGRHSTLHALPLPPDLSFQALLKPPFCISSYSMFQVILNWIPHQRYQDVQAPQGGVNIRRWTTHKKNIAKQSKYIVSSRNNMCDRRPPSSAPSARTLVLHWSITHRLVPKSVLLENSSSRTKHASSTKSRNRRAPVPTMVYHEQTSP